VNGPGTEAVPGSALGWHPNTTIVLDTAAAQHLERAQTLEFDA
jgi:6-phosphogluconolactonase/glucosamine-6-phosphate isomerase/deaminase